MKPLGSLQSARIDSLRIQKGGHLTVTRSTRVIVLAVPLFIWYAMSQETVHTSMCSGVPFVGVGMMPEQDLNIRLAVNKGRRAARGTHFIADIAPFFCTLLLPHTCGKPLAWGILGALAFGAARFLLWLKHIC